MDDNYIIDLYFARSEKAIEATDATYGKLLHHVAFNILHSQPDSEECVNDTYFKAWEAMPPERPTLLRAFLAKITRNLSLNRYIANRKRIKMLYTEAVFEEIAECVPDTACDISEDIMLREAVNGFVGSLNEMARKIFVKRYFYMMSVKEISIDVGTTVSNVKVSLMRTREKFKDYLQKAGITI